MQRSIWLFYIILFIVSFLLITFNRAFGFILLGSAFILIAPFIIIERHAIKLLRNDILAIAIALLCVFIGGVLWHYALILT